MEPIFIDRAIPSDTFLNIDNLKERAISEYKKHGSFIIAFDMDDTIVPSDRSFCCDDVVEVLRICSQIPSMHMIVFTARGCKDNEKTIAELKRLGVRYDSINEDILIMDHDRNSKIFYNVFLCDRAGLPSAYEVLVHVLYWYFHQGGREYLESKGVEVDPIWDI